jgi:hypothetical protein
MTGALPILDQECFLRIRLGWISVGWWDAATAASGSRSFRIVGFRALGACSYSR